jgi:Lhr-like helicase
MNGKKMSSSLAGLSPFHPLIAEWFVRQVGQPTDVQQQSWPKISAGEHLLITAPTGSGKTLTAFLWALDQLITGKWTTGHTSVLYISPLRALNYDIQRNLLGPLAELRQVFKEAGRPSRTSASSHAAAIRRSPTGAGCCAIPQRFSSPHRRV